MAVRAVTALPGVHQVDSSQEMILVSQQLIQCRILVMIPLECQVEISLKIFLSNLE